MDQYARHLRVSPKSVTDITSADILVVLSPIWTEKPETASRVRQRVETVLDWAVAQGYRTDNPATRSITKLGFTHNLEKI